MVEGASKLSKSSRSAMLLLFLLFGAGSFFDYGSIGVGLDAFIIVGACCSFIFYPFYEGLAILAGA